MLENTGFITRKLSMDETRVVHVTFAPKRNKHSKYTPQRVRKICDYVAKGMPYRHACAAVGIAEQTFYNWKEKYPEFQEALRLAEAEFMNYHLGVIDNAQDPQVSMKLLKARFPEHFSDGEKAVNVRMQVEGRVQHEAGPSLEESLARYSGAIEEVIGREVIEQECLPAGDPSEDGDREPVYTPDTDD